MTLIICFFMINCCKYFFSRINLKIPCIVPAKFGLLIEMIKTCEYENVFDGEKDFLVTSNIC